MKGALNPRRRLRVRCLVPLALNSGKMATIKFVLKLNMC